MHLKSRIGCIVSRIIHNRKDASDIIDIIFNKTIRLNTKIMRISDIYHTSVANTIPSTPSNRQYISGYLTQYIKTYYSQQIPDLGNIRIMDVGGGNGDILKNIGISINIPRDNLYCVEPKNGREYVHTNSDYIQYVFWNNVKMPNSIKPTSVDVVIIMVTLHHMTLTSMKALFTNLSRITKPGSLLIIKEHDVIDKADTAAVEWEHILYSIKNSPPATPETISVIQDYYKNEKNNYKSKAFYDTFIESYGYTDTMSPIMPNQPSRTRYNPTNLYWKVYVKSHVG